MLSLRDSQPRLPPPPEGASAIEAPPDPLSPDAIRSQLASMLASKTFSTAARMARFLRFTVEAAIEGRQDELKETGIAIAVFDRPADFDPRADPVVRSEARRLRQRLSQYYEREGQHDPIRIHLPKGGYLPRFEVTRSETAPYELSNPKPEPVPPAAEPQPASRKPPHRTAAWVAVVLILAAAGLSALLGRWQTGTGSWLRNPQLVPLTSSTGHELDASLSPDGKVAAFVRDGLDGAYNIFTVAVSGGPPVQLTRSPRDLHPAWSPDGSQIAFLRASRENLGLFLIPSRGGQERKIAEIQLREWFNWNSDPLTIAGNPGPAWSADGKYLFATDSRWVSTGAPLWRFPVEGGPPSRITHPEGIGHDFYPATSHSGRYLAFVRQASAASCDLYVISLDTNETTEREAPVERRLTLEQRDIRGVTWGPGDKSLVFSSNRGGGYRLWTLWLDSGLVEPVPTLGNRVTNPSLSRNGSALV